MAMDALKYISQQVPIWLERLKDLSGLIQERQVLEMATKEMDRVHREESKLAKETGELGKVRTRRPINIRREMFAGLKDGAVNEDTKLEAAKTEDSKVPSPDTPLEADPNFIEADEGIAVDLEIPKIQYP